jgi:hypothetical protein
MLVVAGGGGGVAGVETLVEQGVEFGRITAEGRLCRGGVDGDDGHLGAFWNVDGAGEADDAVFVDAFEGLHGNTISMAKRFALTRQKSKDSLLSFPAERCDASL